jgi:Domain of unknown function (DUF4278)
VPPNSAEISSKNSQFIYRRGTPVMTIKLLYRGTTYDYNPTATANHPNQQKRQPGLIHPLIYRGFTYQLDSNPQALQSDHNPTTYQLTYRGARYIVLRTAKGERSISVSTG